MGKVAKPKKRDVSIHSRAARRGASPAPDLSAKSKSVTEETEENKPWLYKAQDAGIAKKKKVKQPSRQQKLRQQRGVERAEQDLDKLEKKVANSKQQSRKIQARSVDWDELNGKLVGPTGKKESSTKFEILASQDLEDDDKLQEVDETLEPIDAPEETKAEPVTIATSTAQPQDVDEIL